MKRSAIGFILLLAVTVPLCSCGKAGTEQPQDNVGDTSSEIISAVTDTPSIQSEETNEPETSNGFEEPSQIEFGSEIIRGFTFDNILHSDNDGDIHFGLYIPGFLIGRKPLQHRRLH